VAETTLTIPGTHPAGSYYLISQADGANAVVETNETNNTNTQTVAVGPDLKVTVTSASSPVAAGGAVLVIDTVKNIGGSDSAASVVRYYLSVNSRLDAGDDALGTRSVGVLSPNASATAETSVTIPAGKAPGVYYLIVIADGDGAVAESSEWNNTHVKQVWVN
jgi:subtilase family serine protease